MTKLIGSYSLQVTLFRRHYKNAWIGHKDEPLEQVTTIRGDLKDLIALFEAFNLTVTEHEKAMDNKSEPKG